MKPIHFSIFFMLVSIVVNAQDRSINFEDGSWAEIKAKAAKEKKAIFMDCYTSWCGPCKTLARDVFTNNEVADYFNANFINAKFDMEKGEGIELRKQYSVNAFPTLLFIDAEGKLISKKVGALDVRAFLDFGKKSVGGESLEYLTAEYKKGNREFAFMKKFMARMEGQRENTGAIMEAYFQATPQAKWQTNENWYFIDRYIKNEQSPVFKAVLENQKAYEAKFSADAVSEYFVNVYRNSLQKAANSVFPTDDLKELKDRIGIVNFAGKAKLELECDATIADLDKNTKAYVDIMEIIFSKYPEKDRDKEIYGVHFFCWKMLKKSSDPYVLKKTAKIAEMSMQTQIPTFMDTYASLLFEIGDIDKAIEVEEKILTILKVKPDPEFSIQACQARLEKFKRKKG
ncbi:thioredoxin family protein [Sphingobacterium lumbrici]|uniref:thioredoxin family protein n=1 Tax=Sphingobacterium lumbrici TaxID=2559600 RepID=UPI001128B8C0|nr:thioredoxin family protein [Sphingobacterium lumbrici]